MTVLAIDAGTSSIKAVAYQDGRQVGTGSVDTPVQRTGRYREQDMTMTWRALVAAARMALTTAASPVEGIVTTAQGDGCWLVDEALEPVGAGHPVERRAGHRGGRVLAPRRDAGAGVGPDRFADVPRPAQRHAGLARPVVIEPRTRAAGAYAARYLEMVEELTRRGWLPKTVADTARERFTS